jgi:uncharacterized protein YggE
MRTNIQKCFALLLALFVSSSLFAQEKKDRSIHVIGTAEMDIVPDEIYVSLSIKEYVKDKKKYTIEELEKGVVNYITKTTAVAMEDIKMDNMSAYVISMKRKKNKEEIITKSYMVKFSKGEQVYMLYSVMDSLGIYAANVSRYSHSKMDDYKRQIKINAIKSAKEKASYLLEAIGSKAGKPLSITEYNGMVISDALSTLPGVTNSYSQSYYKDMDKMDKLEEDMVGGKTIKLRYDITAEFEIVQ